MRKLRLRGYRFDVWFSVCDGNLEVGFWNETLQVIPQIIFGPVTVGKLRDPQVYLAGEFLDRGWRIVNAVPCLHVKPLAELVQGYFPGKVSPELMPNFGKQASVHGS